jgi:hypothetical protein
MLSKNALPQIACCGGRFQLLLAGRHGLVGKRLVRIAMPLMQSARIRRVWRRMFFSTCSAGALPGPDFCFIFATCGYDEPEILPP